jgi:predicted RNase H-like nuclease (RuvC/YqgF family)
MKPMTNEELQEIKEIVSSYYAGNYMPVTPASWYFERFQKLLSHIEHRDEIIENQDKIIDRQAQEIERLKSSKSHEIEQVVKRLNERYTDATTKAQRLEEGLEGIREITWCKKHEVGPEQAIFNISDKTLKEVRGE